MLAGSTTMADAAATAIDNLIKEPGDIPRGIDFAKGIDEIRGVIIIIGTDMGVWGEVKICSITL